MTRANGDGSSEGQFTSTSDIGDHLALLHSGSRLGGKEIGDRRGIAPGIFLLGSGGWECGCNVHSIWPTSFGRKSRVRIIQCRSEIIVAEYFRRFQYPRPRRMSGVGRKALRKFKASSGVPNQKMRFATARSSRVDHRPYLVRPDLIRD